MLFFTTMISLPYKQGIAVRLLALRLGTSRLFTNDVKDPKKRGPSKALGKHDKKSDAIQQEESAAEKLNRLLASMSTDDPYSLTSSPSSNLPTPGNVNRKERETLKEEVNKKDVFTAIKRVASIFGDEKQQYQTESELLAKLLGHREDNVKELEGSSKKKASKGDVSLSELIVGMKIDRSPQGQESFSRSDYVRRTLAAARNQQQISNVNKTYRTKKLQPRKRDAESFTGSVNLHGAEPLGIFKNASYFKESPDMLNTWKLLQHRELQIQVAHPPSNYFEKMSLWTGQGKVWRFPIDNEQDWKLEEADVEFSEHIFLEQHLESWCPEKGPIRHFMELVCVGLSKNPYITALEKKEHILWYRDYFESKKEMLKEYMLHEKPKRLIEKENSSK